MELLKFICGSVAKNPCCRLSMLWYMTSGPYTVWWSQICFKACPVRQGNRTELGVKDLVSRMSRTEECRWKRKSKRNGGREGSGKVEEKQGTRVRDNMKKTVKNPWMEESGPLTARGALWGWELWSWPSWAEDNFCSHISRRVTET